MACLFKADNTLVVPDKTRWFHKTGTVFYPQITAEADCERTYVFYSARKINKPHFNGAEDQVFISCSDASAKAEIGFVIKDAFMRRTQHGHFCKYKRGYAEPQ